MTSLFLRLMLMCGLICGGSTLFAAAEELPELKVVPDDTLFLKNDNPITGKVVKEEPNGTLIFTGIGRSGTSSYTRDQYDRWVPRQTAMQVVENRGKILLKRREAAVDLRQTVVWGRKNNAADAALTLCLAASQALPADTELGSLAMEMLIEADRGAETEAIASRLLQAKPFFEPAYIALARIYQRDGRTVELTKLTDEFLKKLPSSEAANRIKAELTESVDLKASNNAYRNNWELRKDPLAGLGYARTSLRLGNYQQAAKTASAMIEANQLIPQAAAYAGAAKLALGDTAAAQAFLAQAVASSDLDADSKAKALYNQGLAFYRAGQPGEARKIWSASDSPATLLALAIVDHKTVDPAKVGADKRLQDIVRELNACIALENQQPDKALANLDRGNSRHRFLAEVAEVQRSNGSESSLRTLAATDTLESRRWQAYGLLLARKFHEAEAMLDKLPDDDGYAAVYRIYIAASLQDTARAKDLFRGLNQAKDAPVDYVAKLAAEYANDNNELMTEEFDWVEGDALASGWQVSAPGTNIRVHASDGKLIFSGTQTASPDPVTRAWKLVPADRLKSAEAFFDIGGIGQAIAGLELLDSEKANGVALGILADNKLGWRSLVSGKWGPWQDLKMRIDGTKPLLHIEYTAGKVFFVPALDKPNQQFALGDVVLPTSGFLAVSLFGTAEVNTAWNVGVERLENQFKPASRPTRKR